MLLQLLCCLCKPVINFCIMKKGISMDLHELSTKRFETVSTLLSLLPYVNTSNREEVVKFFEDIIRKQYPIEHKRWNFISIAAGKYVHRIEKQKIDIEQMQKLWSSVVWAVWYEYLFGTEQFYQRFTDLLSMFVESSGCQKFIRYCIDDLERFVADLDTTTLRSLESSLLLYT